MEKYEFLCKLGEGAYGSVWKCVDKDTGQYVAVKKLKDVPQNSEESEYALREVRLLQVSRHPHVVRLLEAYRSHSGRLYLVFEYVETTLLQELNVQRAGLPLVRVKQYIWQLLQALSFLHHKKPFQQSASWPTLIMHPAGGAMPLTYHLQIIHRDIKPSNILLSDAGTIKLCDFGFARPMQGDSASVSDYTTYVVTRWYRAPEVLVGDSYGPGVDIWALGCIFAELASGRPLFPGKTQHDQLWLIMKCVGAPTDRQLCVLESDPQFKCFRLPLPSEVEGLESKLPSFTHPMMAFMRACLAPDPDHRATADELLAMPLFAGIREFMTDQMVLHDQGQDSDMMMKLSRLRAMKGHANEDGEEPLPSAVPVAELATKSLAPSNSAVLAANGSAALTRGNAVAQLTAPPSSQLLQHPPLYQHQKQAVLPYWQQQEAQDVSQCSQQCRLSQQPQQQHHQQKQQKLLLHALLLPAPLPALSLTPQHHSQAANSALLQPSSTSYSQTADAGAPVDPTLPPPYLQAHLHPAPPAASLPPPPPDLVLSQPASAVHTPPGGSQPTPSAAAAANTCAPHHHATAPGTAVATAAAIATAMAAMSVTSALGPPAPPGQVAQQNHAGQFRLKGPTADVTSVTLAPPHPTGMAGAAGATAASAGEQGMAPVQAGQPQLLHPFSQQQEQQQQQQHGANPQALAPDRASGPALTVGPSTSASLNGSGGGAAAGSSSGGSTYAQAPVLPQPPPHLAPFRPRRALSDVSSAVYSAACSRQPSHEQHDLPASVLIPVCEDEGSRLQSKPPRSSAPAAASMVASATMSAVVPPLGRLSSRALSSTGSSGPGGTLSATVQRMRGRAASYTGEGGAVPPMGSPAFSATFGHNGRPPPCHVDQTPAALVAGGPSTSSGRAKSMPAARDKRDSGSGSSESEFFMDSTAGTPERLLGSSSEPPNGGRRASDGVLMATAALDKARARLTRAASIIDRSGGAVPGLPAPLQQLPSRQERLPPHHQAGLPLQAPRAPAALSRQIVSSTHPTAPPTLLAGIAPHPGFTTPPQLPPSSSHTLGAPLDCLQPPLSLARAPDGERQQGPLPLLPQRGPHMTRQLSHITSAGHHSSLQARGSAALDPGGDLPSQQPVNAGGGPDMPHGQLMHTQLPHLVGARGRDTSCGRDGVGGAGALPVLSLYGERSLLQLPAPPVPPGSTSAGLYGERSLAALQLPAASPCQLAPCPSERTGFGSATHSAPTASERSGGPLHHMQVPAGAVPGPERRLHKGTNDHAGLDPQQCSGGRAM